MGESGHNLRIARSRLGSPRLPFETKGVGKGYAVAGPLLVRKMTPEEWAKYGPPAPVQRPIEEEECGMESVREYIAIVDASAVEDDAAARDEVAPVESAETVEPQGDTQLTREEYLRLKNEGLSDKKIMERFAIKSTSTFYELKKSWGLLGLQVSRQLPAGSQSQPLVTHEYTVAQALELRSDLCEDLHDLNRLLEGVIASKRVIKLLSDCRDECQQKLARIDEVFNSTVVRL